MVASSDQAREAIEAGEVIVGGAPASNASRLVSAGEPVRLVAHPPRFVSRGGEKLDAALDRFAVEATDKQVLDAGASTGGFTDCVLQRGAARVVALDVGHGQLHERLRGDPRVRVLDRTNIRSFDTDRIGGSVDLVVADLSFISLRTVAESLVGACRSGGDLVVLVKPQFEASHAEASRARGVITDPAVWRRVLVEVGGALGRCGAAIMGVMVSPLRGTEGNVEFLVHVTIDDTVTAPAELAILVDVAVGEAVHSAAIPDVAAPERRR